jgi:hypothetical protein
MSTEPSSEGRFPCCYEQASRNKKSSTYVSEIITWCVEHRSFIVVKKRGDSSRNNNRRLSNSKRQKGIKE